MITEQLPRWRQVRQAEMAAEGGTVRALTLPAPEQRATEVPLDDPRVPGGARAFARAAIRGGWIMRATYARGPLSAAHGRSYKIVDSLMVQCRKALGEHRAAVNACWTDGKADQCGHVVAGQGRLIKITEGKLLLSQDN